MTVTSVTLADIQQTLAQMQPGGASGAAAGAGFAADLESATGSQQAALVQELLDAEALGSGASGGTALADQSELLAVLLATGGAGAGTGSSTVASTGSSPVAGGAAAGGVTGSDVVAEAESFEGTPYVWGGTSPSGFDCSGLVQYVYGKFGISLPRTSEEQSQAGSAVSSLADAQPGDLLFFAGSDGTASAPGHVGIYIGNGQMVDAPHTGTSVQVQTVPASAVVGIRRVLPTGTAPTPTSTSTSTPTGVIGADANGSTQIGNVTVPDQYVSSIEQAAASNGIPASLLSALLYHESRFEPAVVSSAGAEGIAQFMPSTAAGMGIDPLNPEQAINGAARLLGSYTRQFGSYADALAAYDAGASAVERYGGVPPYAETQAYVPAVLSLAGLSGAGS